MKTIYIPLILLMLSYNKFAYANYCDSSASRYTVHSFYVVLKNENVWSVPDKNQLAKIEPFISKFLLDKLNRERLAIEKELADPETDGPVGYEGSLFSTWVEGYSNFYVSNLISKDKEVLVEVKFQSSVMGMPYYEGKNHIEEWSESVKTQVENGKCKVSDIYFANSDTLLKRLGQ